MNFKFWKKINTIVETDLKDIHTRSQIMLDKLNLSLNEVDSPLENPLIKYKIDPKEIEWEMDWSKKDKNGFRIHPDMPEKEMIFEPVYAIALLLNNDILLVHDNWYEKTWPKEAKDTITFSVNCSDTFAWGCADAQPILLNEIEALYRHFIANPKWGSTIWCMEKRKQMPQEPVIELMIRDGFDVEELKERIF